VVEGVKGGGVDRGSWGLPKEVNKISRLLKSEDKGGREKGGQGPQRRRRAKKYPLKTRGRYVPSTHPLPGIPRGKGKIEDGHTRNSIPFFVRGKRSLSAQRREERPSCVLMKRGRLVAPCAASRELRVGLEGSPGGKAFI